MFCSVNSSIRRSLVQNAFRNNSLLKSQINANNCRHINNCHSSQVAQIAAKSTKSEKKPQRLYCILVGATGIAVVGNQSINNRNMATSASSESHDDSSMSNDYKKAASVYEFTVQDTFGADVSLDKYKGNVLLIVNIASQCGLTKDNYKELTILKEKYHDKGLRILNFPCNQFASQMPEADGEAMVCHLRDAKADIGDVFKRVDVNGGSTAPLYQYLKAKQGGMLGSAIKWNFTKFLVNKEGVPVHRYAPTTSPSDIAKDIEKLL